MEIGIVGLGRMGGSMAQRLLNAGHSVVVYDPVDKLVKTAVEYGAVGAASVNDMVKKLTEPRTVWIMVPPGSPTEDVINTLAVEMSRGDTIIDGGNSYYRDSIKRAEYLDTRGILFLDIGTSGGILGLEEGYCLMVGGDSKAYHRVEPIFQTLAPEPDRGYGHVGPSGAGHFVKMVHNGIEYGLMEAYAEGFELMQAKQEFHLDLPRIAEIWRYGSVVRSRLLDLVAAALHGDPDLKGIEAYVEDSGEGRWTVQESMELAVPLPVISQSVQRRFRSRQNQPFSSKLLAALRKQFGGHPVRKAGR